MRCNAKFADCLADYIGPATLLLINKPVTSNYSCYSALLLIKDHIISMSNYLYLIADLAPAAVFTKDSPNISTGITESPNMY